MHGFWRFDTDNGLLYLVLGMEKFSIDIIVFENLS
jgi:hypothetical protein